MEKNKEKLSKFAKVLSQLRKERGISQKKAASDLGISQALLSHYEKGIRECGLDFVIKCSSYYGVTTDYLLGVSESRNGIDLNSLSVIDEATGESKSISALTTSTNELLEMAFMGLKGNEDKRHVYEYYLLTLYRGALTLAKSGVLPKELFKLDYSVGRELSSAALAVKDARFVFIEDKSRNGMDFKENTALADIIGQAEAFLLNNFDIG
ncbi:MAG: helix-turn-helix transcriptional regulator [Eubacterium sp.]|nr:helix-turn-helix transcriptional regulator [Eubacterium sp.]